MKRTEMAVGQRYAFRAPTKVLGAGVWSGRYVAHGCKYHVFTGWHDETRTTGLRFDSLSEFVYAESGSHFAERELIADMVLPARDVIGTELAYLDMRRADEEIMAKITAARDAHAATCDWIADRIGLGARRNPHEQRAVRPYGDAVMIEPGALALLLKVLRG